MALQYSEKNGNATQSFHENFVSLQSVYNQTAE